MAQRCEASITILNLTVLKVDSFEDKLDNVVFFFLWMISRVLPREFGDEASAEVKMDKVGVVDHKTFYDSIIQLIQSNLDFLLILYSWQEIGVIRGNVNVEQFHIVHLFHNFKESELRKIGDACDSVRLDVSFIEF